MGDVAKRGSDNLRDHFLPPRREQNGDNATYQPGEQRAAFEYFRNLSGAKITDLNLPNLTLLVGTAILPKEGIALLRMRDSETPKDTPDESTKKLEELLEKAEKFVRKHGVDPEQAMIKAVKTHNITFLGESHTYENRNPHREAIAKIVKDLPKGTRLAIELPTELKPVFDEFNKSLKGSDFIIPDKLDSKYGKEALRSLRRLTAISPDAIEVWKAAHDAGHKIVPVDNNSRLIPQDKPEYAKLNAQRDQDMKDTLKSMYLENKTSPIVAWLGGLHCAQRSHKGERTSKSVAQLMAEDPDFKEAGGKLTSFMAHIDREGEMLALHPLTLKLEKALSVPTNSDEKPNAVGAIPLFEPPRLNKVYGHTLSDYDQVIVYRPQSQADDLQKMKETKINLSKRPDCWLDAIAFDRETKELKLDKKPAETAQSEINKFGNIPEVALGRAMKDSRVLCLDLGEGNRWQHMYESLKLMQTMKANGATHAAFLIPKKLQPVLDEFNRTGTVDRNKLGMEQSYDNLALTMQAALINKIKLVAVGETDSANNDGAKAVADSVKTILTDKSNKVVLAGDSHNFSSRPDSKNQLSVASMIRKNDITTKTAVAIYQGLLGGLSDVLAISAEQPLAVEMRNTPVFGKTNAATLEATSKSKLADYDYVIVLNK